VASAVSRLWFRQATSDFHCGELIRATNDITLRCHAIAKYQQCMEKAVKGVVRSLNESKVTQEQPSMRHDLDHEMDILKRLPVSAKTPPNSPVGRIKRHLDARMRSDLQRCMSIAPTRPVEGVQPRNTEYPFHKPTGTWMIPASADAFTDDEVAEMRAIAARTLHWADEITFAGSLVTKSNEDRHA
jgi:hypothetical protein